MGIDNAIAKLCDLGKQSTLFSDCFLSQGAPEGEDVGSNWTYVLQSSDFLWVWAAALLERKGVGWS